MKRERLTTFISKNNKDTILELAKRDNLSISKMTNRLINFAITHFTIDKRDK